MKRLLCCTLILLTLGACSRKGPTPTSSPAPTPPISLTPIPSSTSTPAGSPVPHITIVPSATRLPPTPQEVVPEGTASAAGTVEPPSTPAPGNIAPSDTPTPRVVDAGSTATQPPTATLPESPLGTPTPTPVDSPLPSPPDTTAPSATSTPGPNGPDLSPTPAETTLTATSTLAPSQSPVPTQRSTPSPTPQGGTWRFDNLYTYYDAEFEELYISGEVFNGSDSNRRVRSLTAVAYGASGNPINTEDDVYYLPLTLEYDGLLTEVSLAPGQSLSFGFLVDVTEPFIESERNPEILIETEPADPPRDDLDIVRDDYDKVDLPWIFHVNGVYDNPGPDLAEYVVLVVTVYDDGDHVIGMGWLYNDDPLFLTTGEHEFEVDAEMFAMVEFLELEVSWYKVQVFGY